MGPEGRVVTRCHGEFSFLTFDRSLGAGRRSPGFSKRFDDASVLTGMTRTILAAAPRSIPSFSLDGG